MNVLHKRSYSHLHIYSVDAGLLNCPGFEENTRGNRANQTNHASHKEGRGDAGDIGDDPKQDRPQHLPDAQSSCESTCNRSHSVDSPPFSPDR